VSTEAWIYIVLGAFVLGVVFGHRFLPSRLQ